jgi:hypothetical protein
MRPINQPKDKGAKIIGGTHPSRRIGEGVKVQSGTNTANADKTKGVEIHVRPER